MAFRLVWAGRTVSQLGDEITLLALPWLVASTTSSPLAVGALEAFAFLPTIAFGLPFGAIADRRSRRKAMVEADLLRAGVMATIPLLLVFGWHAHLLQVLAVALTAGAARALFDSSSQAFLADIVPRGSIVEANARFGMTDGFAVVVGPPLAGVLIATVGAAAALAFDAFTFCASAAALLWVSGVVEQRSHKEQSLRGSIREGLSYIRRQRHILTLTCTVGAANVGSGMAVGLLVIFLQQDLALSGWHAGIVFATNGLGAVVASQLARRLSMRTGLCRTFVLGLFVAASGLTLLASARSHNWGATAAVGMGIFGLGVMTHIVASASLRQLLVPRELLGRVTSSYRTVANSGVAAGALIGGVVGEWFGVRTGLITGAAFYGVVALAALFTPLSGLDPPDVGISAST